MKNKISEIKYYFIAFIFWALLVWFDQWTKYLATLHLKGQEAIPIIPNVFELQYLQNVGAAFGLFNNQIVFFSIAAIFMSFVCFYLFARTPKNRRFFPFLCLMVTICAGTFGNFIDRIRNGFVVDFFYFKPINFPIFNMADIYLTVSIFILIFLFLFYYKDKELDKILPPFMHTENDTKEV